LFSSFLLSSNATLYQGNHDRNHKLETLLHWLWPLQLQLQSGYLVTSASRHLTKNTDQTNLCSSSSMLRSWNIASLEQTMTTQSQQVLVLLHESCVLIDAATNIDYNLLFDVTGDWTHHLPYSRRACWQLHHEVGLHIIWAICQTVIVADGIWIRTSSNHDNYS
jgi:hypothetical protein